LPSEANNCQDQTIYCTPGEAAYLHAKWKIPLHSTESFWPTELTISTAFGIMLPSISRAFKLAAFDPDNKKDAATTITGLFFYCILFFPIFYYSFYRLNKHCVKGKTLFVIPGLPSNEISLKQCVLEGAITFTKLTAALIGLTFGPEWIESIASSVGKDNLKDISQLSTQAIASVVAGGLHTGISSIINTIELHGKNWLSRKDFLRNFFEIFIRWNTMLGLAQFFQMIQEPLKEKGYGFVTTSAINTTYILLYALIIGQGMNFVLKKFMQALYGEPIPLTSEQSSLLSINTPDQEVTVLEQMVRERKEERRSYCSIL
jgi:hypothetical protein